MAGNEITNKGTPYRQGMVFRCDIDLEKGAASNVETLGWNFRNNYEIAVDSFGTPFQPDNDDDGNQGVRINYVMEGGDSAEIAITGNEGLVGISLFMGGETTPSRAVVSCTASANGRSAGAVHNKRRPWEAPTCE